jgi:hypothetical protein
MLAREAADSSAASLASRPSVREADGHRPPLTYDAGVPLLPRLLLRRLGPLGVAVTVYDVWRHVPPARREQLVEAGRRHGLRATRYVAAKGAEQIRKRRG